MNYTLFDLFLNAYNGNSFAQLQIVQRFQPLLKKYAALLKYEDAYSDLQLYLLELLHSGKLTKLQRKDDGTLVKYIESSIRHQYISLNSRKNAVDNSVIASVDEIDFDQMSLSSNDEYLQPVRAFFFFRCSSAAFSPFLQNFPYIQAGSKKHQSSHFGDTLVQHITSPCPVAAGCGIL